MAHWPEKMLATDDFEEKLIQYMSTPIGKMSTGGPVYGSGSTGTATSPGTLYIPQGMANADIKYVSLHRNSSAS